MRRGLALIAIRCASCKKARLISCADEGDGMCLAHRSWQWLYYPYICSIAQHQHEQECHKP